MRETNFKHTDIGSIPHDWEMKRLGELSQPIVYGIAARAIRYDGLTKYIRITDIDDISHRFNPMPLCSPDFWSEDYILEDGDILFARTGSSVGKTYLYSNRDGKLIFAGFLMKAHIIDEVAKYVFYQTLTDWYKSWIESQSKRTGQPGINAQQLSNLEIPMPPFAEQKAIGKALSDIDELIDGLRKLIDKKRNIKQGAMSSLLTGKLRLPGFTKPWETEDLDAIGSILPNNSLSWDCLTEQGSVADIHYGQILTRFGAVVDVSKTSLPHIKECYEARFLKGIIAKDGDIIFADTAEDDTVGKAVELTNIGGNSVVSGLHTFWFRPKKQFASKFLGYAVNGFDFHSQIPPLSTGTKVSSISKPNLLKLVLSYPSDIKEQEAIAKILTDMDAEIESLEKKLTKYEQLKQGMMKQLLTGKIRLI